jgi:hypothetical protein
MRVLTTDELLNDIQDKTMSVLAPHLVFTTDELAIGLRQYQSRNKETTYLCIRYEGRVLFYGTDVTHGWGGHVEEGAGYSVFCKRGELDDIDFSVMMDNDTDEDIDELDDSCPEEDESEDDFFFRNAVWLLNPTIH